MSSSKEEEEIYWDDDIEKYFSAPYWIGEDKQQREKTAKRWRGCMTGYFIDLNKYESVKEWGKTIYDHLASRNMPLTGNSKEFWPEEALERLRRWLNKGAWKNAESPEEPAKQQIPEPSKIPPKVRIRKNIARMSEREVNEYRAAIEELGVEKLDSKWQELAYIHTNWCLHYQEAFLLWHRVYLIYFENLLGMPIPYWNWMSPHIAEVGHPEAGLPKAFRDETYIHPKTGEIRANPLKYALAKDGKGLKGEKWVSRDSAVYPEDENYKKKLDELLLSQKQVLEALKWNVFSTPQYAEGSNVSYPWANIQDFPASDSEYPNRCDFDGLYEQPHDNFHGWVGGDMSNNAYTAFDPVFWSLHSNIDRIYEVWLREHPAAQYTAQYPIQPFVNHGEEIDEANPNLFLYITTGELAHDSRGLGYDFEPCEDVQSSTGSNNSSINNSNSSCAALPPQVASSESVNLRSESEGLWVVFPGVRCTLESYFIDVFLNDPNANLQDRTQNHHYVGRFSRLGMGIKDVNSRCIKKPVTRVLNADHVAQQLHLTKSTENIQINLIVSDSHGNIIPHSEYEQLPGFRPFLSWGSRL